jgi:hypothetical protein
MLNGEATRSKTITTRVESATRLWFRTSLDDKALTAAEPRGEVVHSLAIEGFVRIPDLMLEEIEPFSAKQPFEECGDSLAPVRALSGITLGPGYRKAVLDRIGGLRGCTHFLTLALGLVELHTLVTFLQMRGDAPYENRDDGEWMAAGLRIEPRLVDACIALRRESPVIVRAMDAAGRDDGPVK